MQTATAAPATPAALKLFTLQIPAIGTDWPEHGGKFGGIVFNDAGEPDHLIIVGPEAPDTDEHAKQLAWAESLDANGLKDWTLPDCKQGHILAANRAALDFKRDWYWLKERHAEFNAYAWCQSFDSGNQYDSYHDNSLRARAVRRLAIQ